MIKILDSKNTTARKKANGQPYYKAFVDYERACPDCDEILHASKILGSSECKCSFWTAKWSDPMKYIQTKKSLEENEL